MVGVAIIKNHGVESFVKGCIKMKPYRGVKDRVVDDLFRSSHWSLKAMDLIIDYWREVILGALAVATMGVVAAAVWILMIYC
jgi:hypothetical protein